MAEHIWCLTSSEKISCFLEGTYLWVATVEGTYEWVAAVMGTYHWVAAAERTYHWVAVSVTVNLGLILGHTTMGKWRSLPSKGHSGLSIVSCKSGHIEWVFLLYLWACLFTSYNWWNAICYLTPLLLPGWKKKTLPRLPLFSQVTPALVIFPFL